MLLTSPRIMPWLMSRWKGSLVLTTPISYRTCEPRHHKQPLACVSLQGRPRGVRGVPGKAQGIEMRLIAAAQGTLGTPRHDPFALHECWGLKVHE